MKKLIFKGIVCVALLIIISYIGAQIGGLFGSLSAQIYTYVLELLK